MTSTASRRDPTRHVTSAAAYAGGAAIVEGGITLAVEAKGRTPIVDRCAWDHALNAFRDAIRAGDDHWDRVELPAFAELQARTPHPGRSFTVTSKSGQVGTFSWDDGDPDRYAGAGGSIRAAADQHHAAVERHKQTCKDLNIAQISDESSEHLALKGAAEDRLFECPAPDLAAVQTKLELMWADNRDAIEDYQRAVLADVRRLAGGGVT